MLLTLTIVLVRQAIGGIGGDNGQGQGS